MIIGSPAAYEAESVVIFVEATTPPTENVSGAAVMKPPVVEAGSAIRYVTVVVFPEAALAADVTEAM
jgi:hypothetical protein